jgi:hypothetical protein
MCTLPSTAVSERGRTQYFPISYQDHLLYHYYAGIIFGARGNYRRSVEYFEIVTIPFHSRPCKGRRSLRPIYRSSRLLVRQ